MLVRSAAGGRVHGGRATTGGAPATAEGDPTPEPTTPGTDRRAPRAVPAWWDRARRFAGEPLSTRAAITIVVVAGLINAVVLLRNYRDLIFFFDEWDFIQDRRGWGPDAFLESHNEHLALVAAFVYKVLFAVFGITSYWPYAIALVVSHLACAGVLFALLRSWSSNEVAVLGTTVLLFLGTGWGVLLWPFELGVTVSLAAGMGAILAIERRTPRGDVAACGLLLLSLAAASLGVPFTIGVFALMLARGGWVRRLWIVAVPAVLYGAWYLAYGAEKSSTKAENIPQIPVYMADAAAAALAGVFGMNPEIGRSILIAVAVATVAGLVGRWADRDRVTLVLLAVGVTWSLLCLSRFGIGTPAEPRYIYPGAAFMLLLLAALIGSRAITAPRARVVGIVLVTLSLITNIGVLRAGSAQWRDYSAQVQASLGAMTEVRDRVPDDFQPASQYGPQIRAATFFAAVEDLGSPAFSADEIRAGSVNARLAADDVLRRAGAITLEGAAPAPTGTRPPRGAVAADGTLRPGPAGCLTASPLPGASVIVNLDVPPAGLQVRSSGAPGSSPVGVRVVRYADLSPGGAAMATAAADGSVLRVTPVVAPSEWRLEAASAGDLVICGVR